MLCRLWLVVVVGEGRGAQGEVQVEDKKIRRARVCCSGEYKSFLPSAMHRRGGDRERATFGMAKVGAENI